MANMQGEHSDMMYIVESGVVTCHMDFLRLQHRMQLPAVSREILAVAPVRYKSAATMKQLLKKCMVLSGCRP